MSDRDEIPRNVEQARAQAMVRNDAAAMVYYIHAIQGVEKVVRLTHNREEKQECQKVSNEKFKVFAIAMHK